MAIYAINDDDIRCCNYANVWCETSAVCCRITWLK